MKTEEQKKKFIEDIIWQTNRKLRQYFGNVALIKDEN